MAFQQLTLIVVDGNFGVCRLEPDASIPSWATAGDLFSITRTAEELSVVCPQEAVPEGQEYEQMPQPGHATGVQDEFHGAQVGLNQ